MTLRVRLRSVTHEIFENESKSKLVTKIEVETKKGLHVEVQSIIIAVVLVFRAISATRMWPSSSTRSVEMFEEYIVSFSNSLELGSGVWIIGILIRMGTQSSLSAMMLSAVESFYNERRAIPACKYFSRLPTTRPEDEKSQKKGIEGQKTRFHLF